MKALDALLDGLFDHASMFPPEALSFEDAMHRASRLHDELERPSIVGTEMVVTPEDLGRIDDHALEGAGFTRPCRICLVGVHADQSPDAARTVMAYNDEARLGSPSYEVVTFEVHSGIQSVEASASAFMPPRYILAAAEVQVYWEPKLTDAQWQDRLDDVFAVLDAANGESELPVVGLKLRCAGDQRVSAATFARVLPEVAARRIPFKATQGLHHPLAGMAQNEIGFLGLAAALRLHGAGALPADRIEACLTETDAGAFAFGDGLSWDAHSIDLGRLGQAMEQPFSIGSCSLAEPDADLAALWPIATAAAK